MDEHSRNEDRPVRTTRRKTLQRAGIIATTLGAGTGFLGSASANYGQGNGNDDDRDSGRGRGKNRNSQVSLRPQFTDGESVIVSYMFLPEGGYMSIHDARTRFDESVGDTNVQIVKSLIGITDLFEPGAYANVRVPLFNQESPAVRGFDRGNEGPLSEAQPLVAIPHENSGIINEDGDEGDEFFLVADDEEFLIGDVAYTDGGGPIDDFAATHDVAPVALNGDSRDVQVDAIKEARELIREQNS